MFKHQPTHPNALRTTEKSLTRVKNARSGRASSWDTTGRNNDAWDIAPGETRVLADIPGSGCINHIWMTQPNGYRNVLMRMFWDDEEHPSVLCPLGDFFGLGNEIVNSYQTPRCQNPMLVWGCRHRS